VTLFSQCLFYGTYWLCFYRGFVLNFGADTVPYMNVIWTRLHYVTLTQHADIDAHILKQFNRILGLGWGCLKSVNPCILT
jgi:hypothetical protein